MYTISDLIRAIQQNDLTQVEKILAADPTLVNGRTDAGISLVMLAQYHEHAEIVKTLVAHNAQIDLFDASAIGDTPRASGWLAMQPSLANTFSPDGFTPLGLASFFGHLDIVKLLHLYHADPNIASNNAMHVAPLHSAVAGNHYEIAAKLIEMGANVNAVQADGFTPLMGAAQNGNLQIVQLLLAHGADKNARSSKHSPQFPDLTARDFAHTANHPEIVALLDSGNEQRITNN